jgi:hypothetical protein
MGGIKGREVKTGFCRKTRMQTGSSETLIGWKSGNTTYVPLWDRWRERGYGLRALFAGWISHQPSSHLTEELKLYLLCGQSSATGSASTILQQWRTSCNPKAGGAFPQAAEGHPAGKGCRLVRPSSMGDDKYLCCLL